MASAPPEESVADVSTVAATRVLVTATAVPTVQTSTATPSLTPTPTSTPTLTPLPTETATPMATFTPWPTVPPDEVTDKVMALLADNQNPNCLLPCWWGATPGQTYWQDVEPFLDSLAAEIHYRSSETAVGAEVMLPLPESVAGITSDKYHAFYSWDESGVIQRISVATINISGYDAQTMVTFYGVPDEVWMKTFSELLPGEVLPFQLILVYQEEGISFRYYLDATRTGETVIACFAPGVEVERPDLYPASPRIYVWIPGQNKTIDEIANIPDERYYRLEEKTDLTPQTLYERFSNPDELPCIETPADLWIGS